MFGSLVPIPIPGARAAVTKDDVINTIFPASDKEGRHWQPRNGVHCFKCSRKGGKRLAIDMQRKRAKWACLCGTVLIAEYDADRWPVNVKVFRPIPKTPEIRPDPGHVAAVERRNRRLARRPT
jgi:hypothetical protein